MTKGAGMQDVWMDYLIEAKKFTSAHTRLPTPRWSSSISKWLSGILSRRSRSGASRRQARCLASRT